MRIQHARLRAQWLRWSPDDEVAARRTHPVVVLGDHHWRASANLSGHLSDLLGHLTLHLRDRAVLVRDAPQEARGADERRVARRAGERSVLPLMPSPNADLS